MSKSTQDIGVGHLDIPFCATGWRKHGRLFYLGLFRLELGGGVKLVWSKEDRNKVVVQSL
jgi:hypothetical protein